MAPEKNQDLNLFYIGGHGGFFFLHLLILSGKYACKFYPDSGDAEYVDWFNNFKQTIYSKQWAPSNEWKQNESFPDNRSTLTSENYSKPRIVYTCNWFGEWSILPGKKVIIYTDLETELRLSWHKKANIFYKHTYEDSIITIPQSIKKARFHYRNAETIDGVKYKRGLRELIEQADIRINLHELIHDPKTVLFNNFGIEYNEDQKAHIEHWLSLHPKKLLEKTKLLQEP
jgi:hypothetical protein